MPFDGSGNFTRSYNWIADRDNGIKILATRMDGEFDNFAAAMNVVFFRNGLVGMTGNLNMGQNYINNLGAGSVAALPFKFGDDPNSGIFLDGVNKPAIVANGTKRLEANTTGVAITGALNVSGASTLTGAATVGSTLGVTGAITASSSITADGLIVAKAAEAIRMQAASSFMSFYNAAGTVRNGYLQHTGTNVFLNNDLAGYIGFGTTNLERMRIEAGGNVGIGTQAPVERLHVAGGEVVVDNGRSLGWRNSGGTTLLMLTLNGSNNFQYGPSGAFIGNHEWYSGGAERMRLHSTGLLTVNGNNSAAYGGSSLRVNGGIEQHSSQFNINSSAAPFEFVNRSAAGFDFYTNSGAALAMRIGTLGGVGIGGITPSYTLDVNGAVNVAASNYIRLGAFPFAYGNGANTNFIVSGGASGIAFRNSADNTTIATLSNTGVFSATGIQIAGANVAPLASPTFTGTPAAPTPANGTNTTQIATTAFVQSQLTANAYAPLASPALTGTPTSGGIEIGYRSIPRRTTTTTLVVGDRGGCVALAAGITVPNSVFAAGDCVSLYNDTAGALTITQGAGVTLRLAGSATTGSRTLAARGVATIWFNSASEAIVSGAGVS